MTEPVTWLADGSPHSTRFNDRYHSCAGGTAQALGVFLMGCGLPQRWQGRPLFTILETGFGLGMNFLTTWASWEADPQRCEQLHVVSVEAHPVAAADLVRNVQSATPPTDTERPLSATIAVRVHELARAWESLSPGIQTLNFAQGRVRLTLAVGEVQNMLPDLNCVADAVFLDGFSPQLNPQMWSADTLRAVAQHCRPGTTLATYTVAKDVRTRLQTLGFSVAKCPGLPPKRDRLQAIYRGAADQPASEVVSETLNSPGSTQSAHTAQTLASAPLASHTTG
ncbi:tRNA (5-methylaminomethyl-2-thiouridine)(34)-methyltransferase MnmD [Rhodoferax sp.]|uniref:tRNA (5-methylaminomethyl-2-thiouridine)(34)-methyltransferase MnmD n=1 Tax=Rhodoferax sp. TaxID=50421 RepID=UPI002843A499|nr:tRNA (5-methylaminomethyl-2-thiouridine)(34)-methyltransferase MnmD [Rhodoferax sp.]MDR3369826.1 tRNA (5-methylaminomethyl-2-thiouridine)(34)-methyltransferase MnmD [Rhodoferax sp.]